jgi:hypothetical protein
MTGEGRNDGGGKGTISGFKNLLAYISFSAGEIRPSSFLLLKWKRTMF